MSDSHCIYLNLERSAARRAHMEALFGRMSLPVRRFNAIDGAALSLETRSSWQSTRPDAILLSPGEIGCFLSHRAIWADIVEGTTKHVAVFEDDITFSDDAGSLLRDLQWVPDGVGFVKLDAGPRPARLSRLRPVPGTQRRIGQLRSGLDGTAGYVISKDYARLLLERTTQLRGPLDLQLFYPQYDTFRGMQCWQITPAICIQQVMATELSFLPPEAELSDIDQERAALQRDYRMPKLPFGFAKLKRELGRPLRRWMTSVAKASKTGQKDGWMQDIPFRR